MLFLCLFALQHARAESSAAVPDLTTYWARAAADQVPLVPAAPQIAATSYILFEPQSGAVLLAHNADERLPPASLTKMMTAYVLDYEVGQGNVSLEDTALISVNAWRTGGSRMFVREGTRVRLQDLLRGIVIQSGNDASVAVAEHLAGSEDTFADVMNQHARRLGMSNTQFMNATGLPEEGHYTTARDLALLSRAIIYDFPEQYVINAEKSFTYNGIEQFNRNRLLWLDPTVDGLKTGHTSEAGYCLAATAVRDGMRLIAVIMGARSEQARASETSKLLNFGYRFFESHDLVAQAQELTRARVWSASVDEVPVGAARALRVTVPRGQKANLNMQLSLDPVIQGPLMQGQEIGRLEVSLNGQMVANEPVVALQAVEQAGFLKRLWHTIVLFIKGLFA